MIFEKSVGPLLSILIVSTSPKLRICSHRTKTNAKAKKDRKTSKRDERKKLKHQRNFSLSLGVNGPLHFCSFASCQKLNLVSCKDRRTRHTRVSCYPKIFNFHALSVADLRGTRGMRAPLHPWGPNSFNFMQFLGKFGKIVCWRPPPPGELASPPWGNPGSATDYLAV